MSQDSKKLSHIWPNLSAGHISTWHSLAVAKRWQCFWSAFSWALFPFLLSGLEAEKNILPVEHFYPWAKMNFAVIERKVIWSILWQDLEFLPNSCLFEIRKEDGFHIYDATHALAIWYSRRRNSNFLGMCKFQKMLEERIHLVHNVSCFESENKLRLTYAQLFWPVSRQPWHSANSRVLAIQWLSPISPTDFCSGHHIQNPSLAISF